MNRKMGIRSFEKYYISLFLLFLTCFIVPFGGLASAQEITLEEMSREHLLADIMNAENEDKTSSTSQTGYEWMAFSLTDAVTGESFTIEDYSKTGTPVVIHLFAIWCSICTIQLDESTEFQTKYPGKAKIINLDLEEAEDDSSIAQHVQKNEFTGTFAKTPKDMTMGMIDTFGASVALQIPQTIVIMGRDIFHFGPGLRTTDGLAELLDELEETVALME